MSDFADLVAGSSTRPGRLRDCLDHLASNLRVLEEALQQPVATLSQTERLLRPFLTRSLVEVGYTCLIGRLDAFRLLAIAELQSQPTYDVGVRLAAAIQWTGDVLATGPASDLWSPKKKPSDMTRALLGDYTGHLILRPAFTDLLDYLSASDRIDISDGWLGEMRRIPPEAVVPWVRGQVSTLYSATSKGVHHEFVLSLSSYYDDSTLEDQAEMARKLVACLGLIVNFSEAATFTIDADRALTHFIALQNA